MLLTQGKNVSIIDMIYGNRVCYVKKQKADIWLSVNLIRSCSFKICVYKSISSRPCLN